MLNYTIYQQSQHAKHGAHRQEEETPHDLRWNPQVSCHGRHLEKIGKKIFSYQ